MTPEITSVTCLYKSSSSLAFIPGCVNYTTCAGAPGPFYNNIWLHANDRPPQYILFSDGGDPPICAYQTNNPCPGGGPYNCGGQNVMAWTTLDGCGIEEPCFGIGGVWNDGYGNLYTICGSCDNLVMTLSAASLVFGGDGTNPTGAAVGLGTYSGTDTDGTVTAKWYGLSDRHGRGYDACTEGEYGVYLGTETGVLEVDGLTWTFNGNTYPTGRQGPSQTNPFYTPMLGCSCNQLMGKPKLELSKQVDCTHWSDCDVKDGGCCSLKLFDGKPSLKDCEQCPWKTNKLLFKTNEIIRPNSGIITPKTGPKTGCAKCRRGQ